MSAIVSIMYIDNTEEEVNSQYIDGVFPIEKHAGETLAVLVKRFRHEQNIEDIVPITYAGRLDPMARGLVLLLVGEVCKKKDEYLRFDKTYTFEVLFGVTTDTYDMLGLIVDSKEGLLVKETIEKALVEIKKETTFSYPSFSSKPVHGKALFMHAKEGTLPDTLPTMEGVIKELVLKDVRTESFETLVSTSIETIQKVQGDFRQKEIIDGWRSFMENNKDKKYTLATLEATVTSGVYIRTIATMIGEKVDMPALAYSIERNNVGEYSL